MGNICTGMNTLGPTVKVTLHYLILQSVMLATRYKNIQPSESVESARVI